MSKINYTLEEVFTPTSYAIKSLTYVERGATINTRLKRALKIPGNQIILYGSTGVGKSTILENEIEAKNKITFRCSSDVNFKTIVLDALYKLGISYTISEEKVNSDKANSSIGLGGLLGIKISVANETKTTKGFVELQLTYETLAECMGQSNKYWVIEDFHNIDEEERKKMTDMMKIFMDCSSKYPNLKIIVTGAVNRARKVVQLKPEMKNRISEIEVPLMTNQQLKSILDKGQNLLQIKIPDKVISDIVKYSCGLPAVTHKLAYFLCDISKIHISQSKMIEIPKANFNKAIEEYLLDNEDSIKSKYERATKNINKQGSPLNVLKALLENNKESVSVIEIHDSLKKLNKLYPEDCLKKILDELCSDERGNILSLNTDSMKYYFSDPLMKAYCLCFSRTQSKSVLPPSATLPIVRAHFEKFRLNKPIVDKETLIKYIYENSRDFNTIEDVIESVNYFFKKSSRNQEVHIANGD